MSAAHTPGPWAAGPVFQREGRRAIFFTDNSKHSKWQRRLDETKDGTFSEANARLIAAAPELLRVAEMLVEALADDSDSLVFGVKLGVAHGFARAAIAKATGGAQ